MSKNSEYLIERENKQYEVIIGLEVHAQIISKSKLFSVASTNFGSEPNTQVSLVDAAMPGMLPVVNKDQKLLGLLHLHPAIKILLER